MLSYPNPSPRNLKSKLSTPPPSARMMMSLSRGRDGAQASTDSKGHILLGAGLFSYVRRRSIQKELEVAIKGLQDKYDEAMTSIPEESSAAPRSVIKGIVKAGIKKGCRREIKGKREQYKNKGSVPEQEEYETMLQMLEAAVKDMCNEKKVLEKVGHFIFSCVMFVRKCEQGPGCEIQSI